jgi:aminocarboxymuconate-semialdehyde decarboxylase
MMIDAWTHILPTAHRERLEALASGPTVGVYRFLAGIPALSDLEARFRVMDRFPAYAQILCPVPSEFFLVGTADQTAPVDLAHLVNDALAELVARHPDRFVGFAASVPLANPDRALVELDRAVSDLGALGVQIQTDVGGVPLDDPRFEPFWARIAALDRMVWIHPYRTAHRADFPAESISKFGLWQVFGWPYDTTLALSRLVFSGILERHPTLKVIAHHGGGMVPHFAGRIGEFVEYARTFDPSLAAALSALSKPPIDYFRLFYADTALFGAKHAVRCVVEFFGSEHVLFGTDSPFDPEKGPGFIRDTVADVAALPIDDSQRRAIHEGNVRRVLRIA